VEVACEGCGTCVASCPSNALSLANYEPKQIFSMVDALLVQASAPKVIE